MARRHRWSCIPVDTVNSAQNRTLTRAHCQNTGLTQEAVDDTTWIMLCPQSCLYHSWRTVSYSKSNLEPLSYENHIKDYRKHKLVVIAKM